MAVRGCNLRLFTSCLQNKWLAINEGCSEKLFARSIYTLHCRAVRLTALSTREYLVLPPREFTRGVHTSTVSGKDVNLDKEIFYEKYEEKLDKMKGFSSHQTRAKIKAVRLQEKSRETAFIPPSFPHSHSQYTLLQPPSLDSVMHIEKISDLTADEISSIWREFHKDKDAICAIIPSDKYVELLTKALHCPYFVYPLPHDEGYECIFGQFSGHRCYFTSLINYQQYQENAPVALTLTHYTDLQHSKGIVLMSGELDMNHLTPFEAQYLANQAQLYYNSQDTERYTLLRQFNHEPESFDHRKLVEQLSNNSINTVSTSIDEQLEKTSE